MTTEHRLGIDCWIVSVSYLYGSYAPEAVLTSESDAEWYKKRREDSYSDEDDVHFAIQKLEGGLIEQDKMP